MAATTAAPAPLPQPPQHNRAPNPRRRQHGSTTTEDSTAPATASDAQPYTTPARGNRGGRGGRGAGSGRDRSLAFRPAAVTPRSRSPVSQQINPSPAPIAPAGQTLPTGSGALVERPRRGRGGRGGRVQQHRDQQIIGQNRQFGGSLTVDENAVEDNQGSDLQADAHEFHPGQTFSASNAPRTRQRQPQPQKRRLSKSTAPDIATRIHEDIDNRQYECPICTNDVLRNSKVWNCKKCWTVFHLDCIKKWSANSDALAAQQNAQNGDTTPRQWRCPGCNLPQETKPGSYTCWCGKEHDPRSFAGLPPHSCGQTCGKSRELPKKCPHPCELPCHAGPCPPCTHMGPTQRCFCGKETSSRRCVETHYESGWSCGQPCGDIMPCGEHVCPRPCHEGLCGGCEVRVDARCYCGKEEKAILCCDRDDDKQSFRVFVSDTGETVTEQWTGLFQCVNNCDRFFDCQKHTCTKPCHAQGDEIEHCPRSPDIVSHCPCGKTLLSEISAQPRQSCDDPIPNCSKVCQKQLACGHLCQQVCHTGECTPCLEKVTIHCRCGRTASSTICHQGTEEPPQCFRVCHATLNCGRHECGERCCPGERKAAERSANKRKSRPLNSARPVDDGFEAEHICTRACGRLLKCGNHLCQELCHKGQCGSCREAIFDEISCHCGRTVLQPPLPCGTEPPPCRFDCERRKACGHAQVPHNCHSDEDSCPKCPYLTEKPCLCGKKSLKNQQCWFTDVRCGEICGRKLKCGSHTCRKTCHKPGECEDGHGPCHQPCGKPKKACGHPDEESCHAPYPCREEKPCTHKLIITCPCQHHKQEIKCIASRTSEGNTTKTLKCDDECARLERNRKLALALDINTETHKDDHIPYSTETLSMFQQHPKWCQEQEREFRVFATDDAEKRLRFKPMTATQRAFLHSLSEDFGFDSESMDPEPHRHVALFKSPRFVSAPNKTLRECLRIRQSQEVAAAEAHATTAKAKSSILNEPYNGFLLTNPRFALTIEELGIELAAVQGPRPTLALRIQFLPTGDVAFRANTSATGNPAEDRAVDTTLKELRAPLSRSFTSQGFGTLQLCRFDADLAPVRRELDTSSEGGWSQVAAKAAAPRGRMAPSAPTVGSKSSFTVLTSNYAAAAAARKKAEEARAEKLKAEKKRERELERQKAKANENVAEDWEAAEEEEEVKEMENERKSGEMERTNDVEFSAAAVSAPGITGVSPVGSVVAEEDEEVQRENVPRANGAVDDVEFSAAAVSVPGTAGVSPEGSVFGEGDVGPAADAQILEDTTTDTQIPNDTAGDAQAPGNADENDHAVSVNEPTPVSQPLSATSRRSSVSNFHDAVIAVGEQQGAASIPSEPEISAITASEHEVKSETAVEPVSEAKAVDAE